MKIIIESAIALTESQRAALEAKITQALGPGHKLKFRVEPELIGGLRISAPDRVLDLSLQSRLTQLKHQLFS